MNLGYLKILISLLLKKTIQFDLGWQLKLYKKLRMIEEVEIIGVPEKGDEKNIYQQLKAFISS